jgi:pyrophosphatase PpaX
MELIWCSYAHAVREQLGVAPDRDGWLEGIGRPLRWQFGRIARDEPQVEALVQSYRAYNLAHHDEQVRAFPGVPAALRALAGRGIALAVVTSKLRVGARRGLARAGLEAFFEVVVAADDVSEPKPAPAPVRTALAALGVEPGRALMVGDSPHDLAAGRAAGARTAAVAWGPFPRARLEACAPDAWLEEPADIGRLA